MKKKIVGSFLSPRHPKVTACEFFFSIINFCISPMLIVFFVIANENSIKRAANVKELDCREMKTSIYKTRSKTENA